MIINRDFDQGTQEWLNARSGFVSASRADVLLTPTGKPATGQKVTDYRNKLIAERLMGKSAESGFQSAAMMRGVELEDQARSWYEMATGLDVEQVSLVSDGDISCSPDGLVFDGDSIASGLEIKCPLAHTHIDYLLSGKCPTKYIPQLQVSMLVCGLESWDFLSYHPDLEPLLITVEKDQTWINAFLSVAAPFLDGVRHGVSRLNKVNQAA